jgi:hypothetical protein
LSIWSLIDMMSGSLLEVSCDCRTRIADILSRVGMVVEHSPLPVRWVTLDTSYRRASEWAYFGFKKFGVVAWGYAPELLFFQNVCVNYFGVLVG